MGGKSRGKGREEDRSSGNQVCIGDRPDTLSSSVGFWPIFTTIKLVAIGTTIRSLVYQFMLFCSNQFNQKSVFRTLI